MGRHLLLVRHAKSSWDDPTLADRDRPLSRRGVDALGRMRDHLRAGPSPDLVICSSARRTIETLEGIRPALPDDTRIGVDDSIYATDVHRLLALLRRIDAGIACAMVVGHNPTLQELALLVAGDGDEQARARLGAKFPTGAIATISFDDEWPALGPGTARLDALFTPREPR